MGVFDIEKFKVFFNKKNFDRILENTKKKSKKHPFHGRRVNFFSIWVFFHEHSRFAGQHEKGECISLTPLYHFHPLHRHLDISWAITAVLYTYLFCYYTSVRRSP